MPLPLASSTASWRIGVYSVWRHQPHRALAFTVLVPDLGQRDETQLGIAAGNELVSLGDTLALHQPGLQRLPYALALHQFACGSAVRRCFWIGDGKAGKTAAAQHFALAIDIARPGRPQHQLADGVGRARTGNGMALLFQPLWYFVIGGKKNLERRAANDLGIKLAARSGRKQQLMAGIALKSGGNACHGLGEIGSHRHLYGVGSGGERKHPGQDENNKLRADS